MTVPEERDVVIVGGGIAGLVSAHRLRDRDPVVLEASDRVGGRIWSQQRGDLALSVGAHMFPPPDSVIGRIVSELGLEVMPIPGSMLNIHLGGRLVRDVRPELLPFRLPLSAAGRISFARAGLKVKRDADAYMKLLARGPGDTDADVRLRALKHRGDETFLDFLGKLQPDAFRIFEALANRSLADPDEISQSAMSALFGHVWDTGDLGRNMRGGSGLLPDALGRELAAHVRFRTRVTRVAPDGAGVRVAYEGGDGAGEVRARTAIVAVPATQIGALLGDAATPELAQALARIRFGPLVVLSILTDETAPMPWDDLYSVLTPEASFNMFFNHANALNGTGAPKRGSVLMVYAGGRRGRALLHRPEDEIRETFLRDLDLLYPQVRRHMAESWVKPWAEAGPFAAPGRFRAQAALERGLADRIFLAGDGISEFVSMETAARTAVDAAAAARAVVGAGERGTVRG
jgi:protoporphyrinogen/coproporphyrinogen III oxidase